MKKKIITILIISICLSMVSCSNRISSGVTVTEKPVSNPTSKPKMTLSEAKDIITRYVKYDSTFKSELLRGAKDKSYKVYTIDLIQVGSISEVYQGYSVQGTFWAYDSYGNVENKYNFESKIMISDSGYCSYKIPKVTRAY